MRSTHVWSLDLARRQEDAEVKRMRDALTRLPVSAIRGIGGWAQVRPPAVTTVVAEEATR